MYRQLAAVCWFACALADLFAQRSSTMKLELTLPRDLYLTGEKVDVDIELTNTGKTAVDAPTLATKGNTQPVYHLQGPAYPNGVSFNFHDIHPVSEETRAPAAEPATHRLEAGATMATGFGLTSIKPITEPGEYTLSAKIDAEGWSAQAPPVKFRVEKARFLESSLGVDVNPNSARTMRAVWIAESGGGRMLGETFLYEKRPDLGEVIVTGTRIISKIGARSTNPFVPWTNYDRISAPKFWHGWRDPSDACRAGRFSWRSPMMRASLAPSTWARPRPRSCNRRL